MKSKIFLSLVTVFACLVGYGQKNVRLVYYLKNSGQAVATKDSADYWMVVSPPDSSIDKKLYVVYEYYPNGKVRLMTNSRSKDINLLYQGKYIAYFPDGRKKRIGTYDKQGHPAGHEVQYYPNGKLQSIINYNAEGNLFTANAAIQQVRQWPGMAAETGGNLTIRLRPLLRKEKLIAACG